jgi:hypothetical protein
LADPSTEPDDPDELPDDDPEEEPDDEPDELPEDEPEEDPDDEPLPLPLSEPPSSVRVPLSSGSVPESSGFVEADEDPWDELPHAAARTTSATEADTIGKRLFMGLHNGNMGARQAPGARHPRPGLRCPFAAPGRRQA